MERIARRERAKPAKRLAQSKNKVLYRSKTAKIFVFGVEKGQEKRKKQKKLKKINKKFGGLAEIK
jgi:hypothetical protein